jgi:foldase protein PrsA
MRRWKQLIPLLLAATCMLGACQQEPSPSATADEGEPVARPAAPEPERPAEPTPQRRLPRTAPAGDDILAIVNDEVVYLRPLVNMLLRRHGYPLAQQMVADELVAQEAKEAGVSVTADDIQAERDLQLAKMVPQISDPAQRRQMEDQLLQRLGVDEAVWEMVLRRNALLGKIAAQRLEITDEMIRREFGRQYQRKVVVRHMQLPSLPAAQKMLQRLEQGEDFAVLARQNSMGPTAAQGGKLEPFGAKDETVHPQLRKSAMNLSTPGQVSEVIIIGKSFHLLQLVEFIEPEDVKFEDVRDEVAASLRRRLVDLQKQAILDQLFRTAVDEGKIIFVDPTIKKLHQDAVEKQRGEQPEGPTSRD